MQKYRVPKNVMKEDLSGRVQTSSHPPPLLGATLVKLKLYIVLCEQNWCLHNLQDIRISSIIHRIKDNNLDID